MMYIAFSHPAAAADYKVTYLLPADVPADVEKGGAALLALSR
jgi:hypothetical protein